MERGLFRQNDRLPWGKQKMYCGDWLRSMTEHCLLCVRGATTIRLTNQITLLPADPRSHSAKPDEF